MNPIVTEMRKHFDRCVVIGLNRIHEFYNRLGTYANPSGYHPDRIELFRAIDARKVKPPSWWGIEIPALWACGESHRQVICRALSDGVERLLIMEDDCAFVPDAAPKMAAFMDAVAHQASAWDGLMFGGQVSVFDGLTTPLGPNIALCDGHVERLHCYALSRSGMEIFHESLSQPSDEPNDYRWGRLQHEKKLTVYRIEPFIALQTDGRSSISGRVEANRIWDDRVDVRLRKPETIPVVALVCPFPVLVQLRDAGIVSNGGESPVFMAMMQPGRVEQGEREVADLMLHAFDEGRPAAEESVRQLRYDAAYHRAGPLVVWHYERFIPAKDAVPVRAETYEQAIEQLRALKLIPNE